MAGNILNKYGTTTAITCTLASLTTGSFRGSAIVDNTSNTFTDALVMVGVKSGGSSTSATGYVDVYAYGTVNSGTICSGGASTSDAAYTGQLSALLKLGRIAVIANSATYTSGPWSVAAAFGGSLPQEWGIVVDNESGGTLDSTEANHFKQYQGVYGQYT